MSQTNRQIMDNHPPVGNLILINGASSAGKSTLAAAVHQHIPAPFVRFSFDLFLDSYAIPFDRIRAGEFEWAQMKPQVTDGYRRCLAVLVKAGNNVLVDHIIESKEEMEALTQLFADIDVYYVGLHCSLAELERRELARGNRRVGDARNDLQVVHRYVTYDLELNSEESVDANVARLIQGWQNRRADDAN